MPKLELLVNTGWDLFLGVVPVALGYLLAWGVGRTRPWLRLLWLPVAAAWLFFLPNAPYLLTEVRHYLSDYAGEFPNSERQRQRFLFWTGFYLLFSGAGAWLWTLSVRPVLKGLGRARIPGALVLPLLSLASAFGVYLGLRPRFNSWDLLTRPAEVLRIARNVLLYEELACWYILAFGAALWLLYLAMDAWVDGIALRFKKDRKTERK
ncbi:MAG: DUF1361 domain-containing protein [Armatimonadota bacterium]